MLKMSGCKFITKIDYVSFCRTNTHSKYYIYQKEKKKKRSRKSHLKYDMRKK